MAKYYETYEGFDYDSNLFAGPDPSPLVAMVTLKALSAGTATYKRGTVLGLGTDGKYIFFGSDVSGGNVTAKANMILAEDVTLGTTDVNVQAYRAGHFNRNQLTISSGYTMKAEDEEELRKCGIYLSDAVIA